MDLRLRLDSKPVIYGFTGRQFDPESSTYYYRARTYSPELGRFLTKDPIGFAGGDANLYRYVANDPVNFVDPDGNNAVLPALILAGAAYLAGSAIYNYATDPLYKLEVDLYIDSILNPQPEPSPKPANPGPPLTPREPEQFACVRR